MVFLFIHGGPGLNSNPERNILQDSFIEKGHELYFWNEPSGDYVTFEAACTSLQDEIQALTEKGKLTVIAHSFGAFLLNHVLPHVEKNLARIVLMSPVTSLTSLDVNIIKKGIEVNQEKLLESYLPTIHPEDLYDSLRFEALKIATKDNGLVDHYWNKKDLAQTYYQYFSEPEFQFKIDNFHSIRSTCSKTRITEKTSVPTTIVFGAHDPFISHKDRSLLEELYINSNSYLLEESAHYGHIEEAAEFMNLCLERYERHA